MSEKSKNPKLVKALIHCPKCKKMRDCEIDLKNNNDYDCIISCEECNQKWEVTFKPMIYESVSAVGIFEDIISKSAIPTKEPNPQFEDEIDIVDKSGGGGFGGDGFGGNFTGGIGNL